MPDTTSPTACDTRTGNLRALTILNECGDVTIAWTPDRDREVEAIIAKKMSEGMIFYVIENRLGGRMRLTDAADANQYRVLAIRDEDFAQFVGSQAAPASSDTTAALVPTPSKPVRGARRARTAKEVATSESVGTRPRAGG